MVAALDDLPLAVPQPRDCDPDRIRTGTHAVLILQRPYCLPLFGAMAREGSGA